MVLGHLHALLMAVSAAARPRLLRAISLILLNLCGFVVPAPAVLAQVLSGYQDDGVFGRSYLADMSFGGINSSLVRSAALGGYELSGGDAVDLQKWYAPQFPNLSATLVTELSPNLALMWGGSMGERGEKYAIGPSVNLGLVYHRALAKNLRFEVAVSAVYGGALHEETCIGDYGAIGGLQKVNCRLAAGLLAPAETLKYVWNQGPSTEYELRLALQWVF